jgi:hypothetical protein
VLPIISTAIVVQDNLASLESAHGTLLGLIQHAQACFQTLADLDSRPSNDVVNYHGYKAA